MQLEPRKSEFMVKGNQLYEKEKIHINVARLRVGGEKFEVVIHPDTAIEFKNGGPVDIRDVLVSEKIFTDAHKGMHASEKEMKARFDTSDALEVAKIILAKGEIQLTAEHREKLREEKRKRIINIIHRNSIDPRTNLPHPPLRIENAMEEAKVRINEFKKAEDQIQEIVKALMPIMPIRFETRELEVIIPPEYAAKNYSLAKNYGRVLREAWNNDGSLSINLELPAGMQQDFYDAINKATHGNVQIKVLRSK